MSQNKGKAGGYVCTGGPNDLSISKIDNTMLLGRHLKCSYEMRGDIFALSSCDMTLRLDLLLQSPLRMLVSSSAITSMFQSWSRLPPSIP